MKKIMIPLLAVAAAVAITFAPADARPSQKVEQQAEQVEREVLVSFDQVFDTAKRAQVDRFITVNPFAEAPLMLGTENQIGIGVGVSQGRIITFDDEVLPEGVGWFILGTEFDTNGELVQIEANSIVVFGEQYLADDFIDPFISGNGGVTCGTGYYACCGRNRNG